MKRKKCIIISFMLLCLVVQNVFAEDYPMYEQDMYFYFQSNDTGYNSAPGTKQAGIPYALIHIMEGTVGYTTNYLIAASDGTQITPAYQKTYKGSYTYIQPKYYAAAHEGTVYLRVNTGGTGYGYYVSGLWAANFREQS